MLLLSNFLKTAGIFDEMDVLARAQFLEGFLGAAPFTRIRGLTGKTQLLGKIGDMAKEIGGVSPEWLSKGDTGLYRKAFMNVNKIIRSQNVERTTEAADLKRARSLPGRHNWQNAAAAYAAAKGLGIDPGHAARALLTFPGLAHRMETVGVIGKVRFVNDSKATNADAARQALSSYPKVYWIAGGQPKTGGIDDLADLFPRVIKAYLVGEAAPAFAETLNGKAPTVQSGTIAAAVEAAFADAAAAGKDAVILLSPACASFDQFADFEQRGEAFRSAVQALAAGRTTDRTTSGAA